MRRTKRMVQVLTVFHSQPHPDPWVHGYQIRQETGMKSGVLYPILDRFAAAGLAEWRWENVARSELERPLRRYWRLTPEGHQLAAEWGIPNHVDLSPSPQR